VINNLLVLHLKHPRYGYRRITIKLREKGWFILNEFPGYGVRKAVKYAGNSIRSFTAAVARIPAIGKDRNITTTYGVMSFFPKGWKTVGW
jgi:hypothetical protein